VTKEKEGDGSTPNSVTELTSSGAEMT